MVGSVGSAQRAESLGFDGLIFGEIRTDPLLESTLALAATRRIRVATNVLIAFPRSPMVVAYATRNLQDLSSGRFELGIGTQVRGHITRRFNASWDAPGPRLRDYVQALRAIWACWQNGTTLNYEGRFYQFTLMTPEFDLGPSPYPTRVHVAAINSYNVATAARLCDGLTLHSLLTPAYLQDVIWPAVEDAAASAGRPLENFEMIGNPFLVWGGDADEVAAGREQVRRRIAFYASTRAYAPVLEHHGLADLGVELRKLIAEHQWDELVRLVSDDVLDLFCIAGVYEDIADRVRAVLGSAVDRIHIGLPQHTNAAEVKRVVRALDALHALPTARERRMRKTLAR